MKLSNIRELNRFQATAGHFGLSLLLLVAIVAFMYFVWFPNGLFFFNGGIEGLKILIPVDLVLGPLLTLVIFNPKKKSLKLDLAVIFLIQIAALSWGVLQVEKVRPHYLVAFEDTLYVVEKSDLDTYIKTVEVDVGEGILPEYTSPFARPQFVTVNSDTPEIALKRKLKLQFVFISGEGPWLDYFDYIPFDTNIHAIPSTAYTRTGKTNVSLSSSGYPLFSAITKE